MTSNPTLAVSMDRGQNWTNHEITSNWGRPYCLAINPKYNSKIYVGGMNEEHYISFICKSTDYGETWTKIFDQETTVYSIGIHPQNTDILYAATGYKTYISEDGGESWNTVPSLETENVNALRFSADGRLFAARDNGIEFLDNGWESLESNLVFSVNTSSIDFDNSNNMLYLGTTAGVIQLDMDIVSSVDDDDPVIITGYALKGNYPNPFNSGTTIAFSIPVSGHVRIDIFNAAGQKIKTLNSALFETGNHLTFWDGRNDAGSTVASGIYFYRLTAAGNTGNTVLTKKMLLIK